jgi:hypothetical protein
VAELADRAVQPEQQLAVHHDAAAHAGPEREADQVARSAAGAGTQLGQRVGARVID